MPNLVSRITYPSRLDGAPGSALESRLPVPNRILIVDDEPLNLDLLDQELAGLGHATERATRRFRSAFKTRNHQSGSRFTGLSDAWNERY